MYGAIWRLLPGPAAVRVVLVLVLLALVLALLWYVAFPWVDDHVTLSPGTVD